MCCEMFGWDYQTYVSQPNWFIDLLLRKQQADAELRDKKSKS